MKKNSTPHNQGPCRKMGSHFHRYFIILFMLGVISSFNSQAQVMWSNSSSWTSFGATKPVAGDPVTIPEGVHMILDETPPTLANLTILGKLEFDNKALNLTAGWIMVHGTLQVGTATVPYVHKAIITLNATNPNESVMGMGTRGIMVMGGKLELHGVPPAKPITKLNNHAAAGSTALTLLDGVTWGVNDEIVVAPSDFYGTGEAQRTQITAVNGSTSLTIQNGLNAQRWGRLQYLTATGMSLTPGTLPANLSPGTPTVLDERAEVASLTRNIVVQSVDDALWQNDGFGCHIMIMKMNGMIGEAHLNGIEIKRGGQAGKLGRYPFHWHMLSYEGSATLADATGQYIRNSTVNQSAQRGIVIHGTNGTEVSNNVVYDVRGHGIFTEDASERRNIIDGNLVLKVRSPLFGKQLKEHEVGSASGFWLSNPDNTIINNRVADCEGFGFWMAYPQKTFGQSAQVAINPSLIKFGIFNNNHTHSNQGEGIMLDNVEQDDAGNTATNRYVSTTDMQNPQWPFANVLPYELADYSMWKNNVSGIWNRSGSVHNRRVVNADNTSSFFSGATDDYLIGLIEKSLVVGVSLNTNMNGVIRPNSYGSAEPRAFASYHSTFDIQDNVAVNFQPVQGEASGVFALNDYYLTPVDKGTVRNPNNIIIRSHPGVRSLPKMPNHVYGVIWDPHNYWGGPATQDNYYAFDTPFFTYGLTPTIVQPSREVSGGVILPGPFYGFSEYFVNGVQREYEKIYVTRTTAAGAFIGDWVVEAGAFGDNFGNMRHFATHPTGYYNLEWPTINNVSSFSMNVSNMMTANDYQVLSVEYSGTHNITQLYASAEGQANRNYVAVSNFQAVVNASTGEVFWQDKPNNKVWFKVRGGVYPGNFTPGANRDINLYLAFKITATGTQAAPDTQAPSIPVNLAATNITSNSATITWNASTDNTGGSGVNGYEVFRGGVSQGIVTGTTYNATGLTASTAYSFRVRSRDAAGNFSAQSTAVPVNTLSNGGGGGGSNLALSGDAYTWDAIPVATSTSDFSKAPNAAINNNITTVEVVYNDVANAGNWQGAGIVWSTAQASITSIKYYNGTHLNNGQDNGSFTANMKVQSSTNGTTWTNVTGWTINPTYPYGPAASNQTYTLSGPPISNVKGIRVIGQVRTNDLSWSIKVKELEVFGSGGTQPPSTGNGQGYYWRELSTAASDGTSATKIQSNAVNDGLMTSNTIVDNGTDGYRQAVGIIWPGAKTNISSVKFYHGTITPDGGWFTPGETVRVQYQVTPNGTWTNVQNWSVSPAYSYTSAASNQVYTFSGPAITQQIVGIRVIGKVKTNQESWAVYYKELEAYAGSTKISAIKDEQQFQLNTNTVDNKQIITVYPNPVSDGWITVTLNAADQNNKVSVSVSDLSGRVVFKDSFVSNGSSQRINLGQIQSGLYVIRLTGSNMQFASKIVVE